MLIFAVSKMKHFKLNRKGAVTISGTWKAAETMAKKRITSKKENRRLYYRMMTGCVVSAETCFKTLFSLLATLINPLLSPWFRLPGLRANWNTCASETWRYPALQRLKITRASVHRDVRFAFRLTVLQSEKQDRLLSLRPATRAYILPLSVLLKCVRSFSVWSIKKHATAFSVLNPWLSVNFPANSANS